MANRLNSPTPPRRSGLPPSLQRERATTGLKFGLAALFVVALFALRLLPAGQERFAYDEAHHAGWARLIANGDPFMKTIAVDKPPQLFYLVALAYKLFGENEVAARLPNAVLGALAVLPLWGLARKLYPSQPGLPMVAVGLFALSPLAQVYAPTVFTDPLMSFWLLVCGWLVASGRWGWAGLAFGLAVCSKQQALFFLPFPVFLAVALNLSADKGEWVGWLRLLKRLGWTAAGVAAPVLVVFGFDKWRGQTSSLTYGAALNGDKLGLASPERWLVRLTEWWNRALQYFFVPNPFGLLILVGLVGLFGWTVWRSWDMWRGRRNSQSGPGDPLWRRTALVDLALFAAIAIVVVWHTILTFPVWDRYLLPMVPFGALLVVRLLIEVAALLPSSLQDLRSQLASKGPAAKTSRSQRLILTLLTLLTLGLMVRPVAQAESYKLPLGGDYLAFSGRGAGQHYAFDGIDEVARFFPNNARPGAVVFQEELDWHFSFYLFGQPLQLPSNKSRPLDPALVASRAAEGETYVVFTDWQVASYKRLQAGLAPYNLWLEAALEVYPFSDEERLAWVVYRVAKT